MDGMRFVVSLFSSLSKPIAVNSDNISRKSFLLSSHNFFFRDSRNYYSFGSINSSRKFRRCEEIHVCNVHVRRLTTTTKAIFSEILFPEQEHVACPFPSNLQSRYAPISLITDCCIQKWWKEDRFTMSTSYQHILNITDSWTLNSIKRVCSHKLSRFLFSLASIVST